MENSSGEGREIPVLEGLPPAAMRGLAEFVKTHYPDARLSSLSSRAFRETWSPDDSGVELEWEFTAAGAAGTSPPPLALTARLSIGPKSVSITFPGSDATDYVTKRACDKVADDLELLVTSYLARARTSSLYFIFPAGGPAPRDAHAPSSSMGAGALRRIMSGNMMNLYLLIMAASFGLFLLFGDSAIFAVLAIQLVALFHSDRLALITGKVRPTAERPGVTVVGVPVSPETRQIVAKYAKNLVSDINDRLEKSASEDSLEGPDATKMVQGVLATSGIKSEPEDITIVTRDVYGLVKGVADRFHLPVPKITIMNNVADNAAATGVSPGHATVAITAGSLEDLGDEELSAVLGHEMGHIRGRDSLILFCVTFSLYIGGLYLWLPLLLYLGLIYYLVIFAIIFAVGKVLETRADTESVAKLGDPNVLASALTKIGFRQLYFERYSPGVKFFDWLRFDPHPPIYFRVQRLSKFASGGRKIGNTLLISIRDCVSGFLRSVA